MNRDRFWHYAAITAILFLAYHVGIIHERLRHQPALHEQEQVILRHEQALRSHKIAIENAVKIVEGLQTRAADWDRAWLKVAEEE